MAARSPARTLGWREQLDGMSPRDRKLLAGLFVAMVLFGCFGMYLFLSGMVDDATSKLTSRRDALDSLDVLAEEYAIAEAKIRESEQRLESFKGQSFATHVERTASKAEVREALQDVSESGSEVVGSTKRTSYKVELKRVPLASAVSFLYDLETSDYPLTVDVARFKSQSLRGEKQVNLSLEVSAWSLAAGSNE